MNNNLEPIELNIHYGEGNRKASLKAYKCEMEMKKAVKENKRALKYYLFNNHDLSFIYDVKVTEPGDATPIIEQFSVIDLINSKLTSINASICLSTYEIYKERGIMQAIGTLHQRSPLTII